MRPTSSGQWTRITTCGDRLVSFAIRVVPTCNCITPSNVSGLGISKLNAYTRQHAKYYLFQNVHDYMPVVRLGKNKCSIRYILPNPYFKTTDIVMPTRPPCWFSVHLPTLPIAELRNCVPWHPKIYLRRRRHAVPFVKNKILPYRKLFLSHLLWCHSRLKSASIN